MPPAEAVDGWGTGSSLRGVRPSRFPAAGADARLLALPAYPRLRLCRDAVDALGWQGQAQAAVLKGLDRWPAHLRIVAAMARQAPVARVVRPAAGPLRLDALADRIEAHVRTTARGGA